MRVDPTGKAAGRGAYLHDRRSCWERGLKGGLAHALKVELTDQDRETLRGFMATLPDDAPAGEVEAHTQASIPERGPGTERNEQELSGTHP
jgi:hypothetical protein